MAYKALYRTYRPQKFSEIVGQEVVVKTLQNAIINKKISHAYLFTGPRGTGKTSIARIFAKALNCLSFLDTEPCCQCSVCQEISEGNNPDVIEIDAASNNGVDEIREIREKVKYLPSGAKYKIYIIDEVHMLSGGAFNALLKTLEEPPKHVIFILATTEFHKLPATIVSRCQKFEFKLLTIENINFKLKEICQTENVVISEEAANSIAEASEGAMRDALSILDQAISYGSKEITIDDLNGITGTLSFEKIMSLAVAIDNQDIQTALENINELLLAGKEITKIAVALLIFYRDALLYKSINVPHMVKYIFTKEKFQNIANNTANDKLLYYIDLLSDIQNKVKNSQTPNVFLEIALIKMCSISGNDLDLKKRIDQLEEKLATNDFARGESLNQELNNEKLTFLEGRINHIVSELSKLELHKLSAKVLELEQNQPLADKLVSFEEIGKLKNQIEILEAKLKVHPSEEVKISNYDDTVILSRLDSFQKDLSLSNQAIEKLRQTSGLHNQATNFTKVDLTDIEEKMANLEKKIYQILAGELADKKITTRQIKKPNGQIMLFGDNITTIDDYRTKTKKKYDFADLEKPSHEVDDQEKTKEESSILIDNLEKDVQEETVIETQEEALKKNNIQDISVYYDHLKKEETTNKPHSSLVIRKKVADEKYDLEKQMIAHESGTALNNKPTVQQEVVEKKNDDVFVDKFASYDIKYIEQILHDTKNAESRNDKGRLEELWKVMARKVDVEVLPIVETLQEGQIVAVGNKEFIIVFQNIGLCNQVMRPKFKNVALKTLYGLLNDSYNYIALPVNVWSEKSTEYKSQYFIGVKYPVLSPINIDELEVIKAEDEYTNEKEKTINQTLEMFGDKIVSFE